MIGALVAIAALSAALTWWILMSEVRYPRDLIVLCGSLTAAIILPNFFAEIAIQDVSQAVQSPINAANLLQTSVLGIAAGGAATFLLFRPPSVLAWALRATPFRYYLAFAGLACTSAVYSSYPFHTFAKAAFILAAAVIIITCIVALRRREDPQQAAYTLWRWVIGFCAASIGLLLVNAVVDPANAFVPISSSVLPGRLRGSWFRMSFNGASQLSSLLLLIALIRISRPRSTDEVWTNSLLFALGAVGLILTWSRASIAVTLLLVPFILRQQRRTAMLVLGGLAVVVVAIPLRGILQEFLLRGQTAEQFAQGTGRLAIWLVGLNLFLEQPLLGHGYYVGGRILAPERLGLTFWSNLDNTFLEVAAELGVIGLAAFLVFLGSMWLWFLKNWSSGNRFFLELFLTLVVISLRSVTGPTFHRLGFNLLLIGAISIGIAGFELARERKARSEARGSMVGVAGPTDGGPTVAGT